MPISKTKDLLDQLFQLESSLNKFSYEELNTKEAVALKRSFDNFKNDLENRIFQPEDSSLPEDTSLHTKERENTGERFMDNEFIAHVSHEIRTPLNGIIGFANLLKEEKLDKSQLKKVDAIRSASFTLMEIINEILEYSKLTSGMENFNSVDFNFHGLIKDVMFLCKTLIVDKNIDLKVHLDPKIPKILCGDPSKLSQVLLNLLGNAIKFVEKGHVKLAVEIKEQEKNSYVLRFSVEDTGIGIPKAELNNVFERYRQVERTTSLKYGGTGLGLSIVKEIIEKQKGEITVKSKEGIGTTFEFLIPYVKGTSQHIPKKDLNKCNIQKGRQLLEGTGILVFEDNVLNQHLISEQLNKWGCRVYVTDNGKKGIDMLKTLDIDLVLMDLKMPGMSGFEVSRKIRSIRDKSIGQIPIIALSADFSSQDQKQCISSGINDFILKPYTLDELLLKVLKTKKEKRLPKGSAHLLRQKTIAPIQEETIDLDAVLKDCFGKVDMLTELIRLFKQNVLEFVGRTKVHLANNDLKEISLAAHKLKAGLTMMKAGHLRNIIVQIEEKCKQNERQEVTDLFELFLKEYPKNEAAIDSALIKLKKE
ncbi:ATP-binding protein [Maribacter sp. 2304DJ31-5]|uniref:ATP-binding protein n=1 Tax=Maribacter sp. 2304DJ31-5 TaxID=3386273 RepID=UPI0039BCBE54